MKSSKTAKMKAPRRTRHVPKYEYFAQIFSGELKQNLSELLNFDGFADEESKKTEDGKSVPVWSVSLDQVKTLFLSQRRSRFDIWQSKDEGDLVKVTTELQKKLFKQKLSSGARIKKGSEIKQPKKIYTEVELLEMGIHMRPGSGGIGIMLYRIQGSALGDVEKQIGYGQDLRLAIENAIKNGNFKVPKLKAKKK